MVNTNPDGKKIAGTFDVQGRGFEPAFPHFSTHFKYGNMPSKDNVTLIQMELEDPLIIIHEKKISSINAIAKNSGPHPIEFDSLVGKKMLFVVDRSLKQAAFSDGSYRVKRVCMDPIIIESFYSQCPFPTPSKQCLMLLIWTLMLILMTGDDFQFMEFVKDLIVTLPVSRGKAEIESGVPAIVKRILSKVFDRVAKGQTSVPLKKVKTEE
ncbi:hypothetical protein OROGR_001656 [Orobanche gracilis]